MTCTYTWIGDDWAATAVRCPPGQTCPKPDYDGSYTGQTAQTSCEGPH